MINNGQARHVVVNGRHFERLWVADTPSEARVQQEAEELVKRAIEQQQEELWADAFQEKTEPKRLTPVTVMVTETIDGEFKVKEG